VTPKEIVKPTIKEQKTEMIDNSKREKPISKVVLLFEDGTFIDYNKK
jgi:hypothetical protein